MNCIAFVYCTYLLGDNSPLCFFPFKFLFVVEIVLSTTEWSPFLPFNKQLVGKWKKSFLECAFKTMATFKFPFNILCVDSRL